MKNPKSRDAPPRNLTKWLLDRLSLKKLILLFILLLITLSLGFALGGVTLPEYMFNGLLELFQQLLSAP